MNINPKLDLTFTKILDITPEQAWKGWTSPEHYGEWFCPKPWTVSEARLDLRPGGEFFAMMKSPEGDQFPNAGCILELIPNKKFVWTSAMLSGFRPADKPGILLTAVVLLEAQGTQTKYTAIAMHATEEDCMKHKEMGFEQGWSTCADQLVQMIKNQ